MPWVNGAHVAAPVEMGAFSPLREYFVNLRQSLRPMLWVNGVHIVERETYVTGRPIGRVI